MDLTLPRIQACLGLPMKVAAMLKIEGKGVSEYETPDFADFKRD